MLTIVLSWSFLSLSTLPDVFLYDIPMAQVVYLFARSVHLIYLLIIFGEVFTSVIGNLYGLEKQVQSFLPVKSKYIFAAIMITAYITSQIGYGRLISTIYPLFGYVSLAFHRRFALQKSSSAAQFINIYNETNRHYRAIIDLTGD